MFITMGTMLGKFRRNATLGSIFHNAMLENVCHNGIIGMFITMKCWEMLSQCDVGKCSSHWDGTNIRHNGHNVGKISSQCDVGKYSSQCDVGKCSSQWDSRNVHHNEMLGNVCHNATLGNVRHNGMEGIFVTMRDRK